MRKPPNENFENITMPINRKAAVSLLCATALFFAISVAQQRKLPPDYEKKREAISNFEAGVVPLFVLGDLNEDGMVDQEDVKLLRAYVAHSGSAGISCLAAADLDDNGSINAHDIELLERILSKGAVKAPALSAHARLGCDFKHFFIAALPQGRAGSAVPIHFLDPRFNPQNSTATIFTGPATVVSSQGAFLVQVAKSAPAGAIVTVALTLADKHRYLYSFRVAPAPGQL
jgi:dockerin type I repeat protein